MADREPRTAEEEAPTVARRAFIFSMVWPAAFLVVRLDLLWIPGLSGVSRLIIIAGLGFVGSIGAIRIGRRVQREGLPGQNLAKTAALLGWIELLLTILGVGAFAILLYAFAHSDWTF